jgi:hypothetical protein
MAVAAASAPASDAATTVAPKAVGLLCCRKLAGMTFAWGAMPTLVIVTEAMPPLCKRIRCVYGESIVLMPLKIASSWRRKRRGSSAYV